MNANVKAESDAIALHTGTNAQWHARRLAATPRGEHHGGSPDIVTLAKSLASGTTLSAVVGRADIMDTPNPGGLGGTYAGNPLAVAAAHAVPDVIAEERLCDRAQVLGARLVTQLQAAKEKNSAMGDVRALGAMVACDFVHSSTGTPDAGRAKQVQQAALKGFTAADLRRVRQCHPVFIPLGHRRQRLCRSDGCFGQRAGLIE
jgi:acetylornithine/succinyldiaminopimelate/putrescine aminotransferase